MIAEASAGKSAPFLSFTSSKSFALSNPSILILNAETVACAFGTTRKVTPTSFSLSSGRCEYCAVTAAGENDFYKFVVTTDMLAKAGADGVKAVFDIDRGFAFGDSILWASRLTLHKGVFNSAGTLTGSTCNGTGTCQQGSSSCGLPRR